MNSSSAKTPSGPQAEAYYTITLYYMFMQDGDLRREGDAILEPFGDFHRGARVRVQFIQFGYPRPVHSLRTNKFIQSINSDASPPLSCRGPRTSEISGSVSASPLELEGAREAQRLRDERETILTNIKTNAFILTKPSAHMDLHPHSQGDNSISACASDAGPGWCQGGGGRVLAWCAAVGEGSGASGDDCAGDLPGCPGDLRMLVDPCNRKGCLSPSIDGWEGMGII
ncbi:hypothetical protein DFP72DRAFT_842672 [Ephemerocybe angulata]|uniref:Uncharacterized protein n=1 Tax=Ephemerocybe angulata TaxID=980116 RepID=A0A8H6MDG0_9AGAR|nr:hypothetical protein DFP72DRAFT_842672 [Tulosesus angulatus]